MRHSGPATQKSSTPRYAAGTRVDVHRSRFELERVLCSYGGRDFAFVEDDANASIQFAIHGRYVQLAFPLPDPGSRRFSHTASGRRRTAIAQERAYEQALRENWRAFVLVVRGKLESVQSGVSTFEDEFASFLLPSFAEKTAVRKSSPKAVRWLLRSSHSLAFAMVAMFLLPASAVTAFALPPSVVERISAPLRGTFPEDAVRLATSLDSRPGVLGGQQEGENAGDVGDVLGSSVDGPTPSPAKPGRGAGSGGEQPGAGDPNGKQAPSGPADGQDFPAGEPTSNAGAVDGGQGQGSESSNGNAKGAGKDNGKHLGAEKGKKAGEDKGQEAGADQSKKNGTDNGKKNGADQGSKNGADQGSKNGADKGNKSGADKASGHPGKGSGGGKGASASSKPS
jgi:hypothetical protein